VYYEETRERALDNGCNYHLAAFLKRRGRLIRVGINSMKTHPRFARVYPDGNRAAHMHAEMDVLRFAQPGDELEVIRYQKSTSTYTMAKPCWFCMKYIRQAGIKKVKYTNWQGDWEELQFSKTPYKKALPRIELIKLEDS